VIHNKTRKVVLASAAAAVVMAITLSGCSSNTATTTSGLPKTGNIRILANITPQLTKDYYLGLVAPWLSKHPGVKISIEVPSGDNVQDTLQQELASGSTPDMVASSLAPLVAPQLVAFPKADWVMNTPLAKEGEVNGQVVQVATGTQIQSLVFYNKTAFEKAGITEVPKTVDEYTADLKALTAAGYVGFDTSGDWVTGAQFEMLADPSLLTAQPNWFVKKSANTVSFAKSAYSQWLSAYEQWVKDGSLPKSSLGQKYQDTIDSFTSGKAATYPMGNWAVPAIDAVKKNFDVGVFPSPTFDGKTTRQLSNPAQPYSILKSSKNQALALDLVKFLVTDKATVSKSLKSEGNFRKDYTYAGSALNADVSKILNTAPGVIGGLSTVPGTTPTFGDQLNTTVQSLMTGKSASSAAESLDTWWATNGPTK
jgi:ABC-type glycerol-3-phosphate transport system substrate-binding protein